MKISKEKAYCLGLLIGGGVVFSTTLTKQSQSKSTTGLFSSFQVANIRSNEKKMAILK